MILKSEIGRKLVNLLEFFAALFDGPAAKATPKHQGQARLLIVRNDGIGDYFLFRNFLQNIKQSNRYKNHHITLLGNALWLPIAKHFDADTIDEFIAFSPAKASKSIKYRKSLFKQLQQQCYDCLLYPVHSRSYSIDKLCRSIKATQKIAAKGDHKNSLFFQRWLSDSYYTQLIPEAPNLHFEFHKNEAFFNTLLGQQPTSTKLHIKTTVYTGLPKNLDYAVFFTDAAAQKRRWAPEKFAQLADYVATKTNYEIILCGTTTTVGHTVEKTSCQTNIRNLIGKTSLVDLVNIIGHAKLLVSNDTGALHIGAATGTPSIGISNGNHYGRFVPYPLDLCPKHHTVFPPELVNSGSTHQQRIKQYSMGSGLDINSITLNALYQELDKLL